MPQNLPRTLRDILMARQQQPHASRSPATLQELTGFGPNPGQLRLFAHVPGSAPGPLGLVVVLHGCGQTAPGYDIGAGWSTLADRYGFAVLMPEQNRINNPNGCFNWFCPADTRRGEGEVESIRQMIAHMVDTHDIDERRVFITGLSAGGAMTSAMLACYPELFAGGAIIAGLPYGAAFTMQQALASMHRCPVRPPEVWASEVRRASDHRGPWPRVSVWHGSADAVVVPQNAQEILKQWTALHGLPMRPTHESIVDGHARQVWIAANGQEAIEFYSIAAMAHGTPLSVGQADNECGATGPFLLDVGISSSYHSAKFFGLTGKVIQADITAPLSPEPAINILQPAFPSSNSPRRSENMHLGPQPPQPIPSRVDVGAVIRDALRTAGLMK